MSSAERKFVTSTNDDLRLLPRNKRTAVRQLHCHHPNPCLFVRVCTSCVALPVTQRSSHKKFAKCPSFVQKQPCVSCPLPTMSAVTKVDKTTYIKSSSSCQLSSAINEITKTDTANYHL